MRNLKAMNPQSNRRHNRSIICRMILQNPGISRSEIADRVGLTRASVTNILSGLIEEGLVVDSPRAEVTKKAGARSHSLAFNSEYGLIVAVNIGHYSIAAAVYRVDGSVAARTTKAHRYIIPVDESLNLEIANLIEELLPQANGRSRRLLAIGVAAPGYFNGGGKEAREWGDGTYGQVDKRVFDWRTSRLVSGLQRSFHVPVFAGNCTDFAATAESWFGAGRDVDSFVLYSIGLGVGSGIVVNGRPYHGQSGAAGEIGHTTVNPSGPRCYCGNRGCLETYASLGNFVCEGGHGCFDLSADLDYAATLGKIRRVLIGAASGDPAATRATSTISKYVAIGAVTLINVLAPVRVIIAPNELEDTDIGPVVQEVRRCVRETAFPPLGKEVELVQTTRPGELELQGVFVGAIELVARLS